MTKALAFSILMLIWIAYGLMPASANRGWLFGGILIPFLLFLLLGWSVYGPLIKG